MEKSDKILILKMLIPIVGVFYLLSYLIGGIVLQKKLSWFDWHDNAIPVFFALIIYQAIFGFLYKVIFTAIALDTTLGESLNYILR